MDNLDKFAVNFWANVTKGNTEDDCWKWKGAKSDGGYGNITIRLANKRQTYHAHRVSYAIHFGNFPEHLHVLHHCDNPECPNPKHLFLGTNLDNVADRQNKGRTIRPSNALPDKTVLYILSQRSRRVSSSLATELNVSIICIQNIWNRRTYRHL